MAAEGKRPVSIPSRVGPGQFTTPAEPMVLAHGFQVRGLGQLLELAQDLRVVLGQIASDAMIDEQLAEVGYREDQFEAVLAVRLLSARGWSRCEPARRSARTTRWARRRGCGSARAVTSAFESAAATRCARSMPKNLFRFQ